MTDRAAAPPRRNRVRTRLAVGLTVSTLLVAAVVAVAATGLSAWQSNDDASGTQAGAARVGEDVTVVIVTDDNANAAAAQARTDTLRWALIALALSVIPAIGVGWFAAGRMLGTVDDALAGIEAAEEERLRRLQEVVHELRTPLAVMGTNLELAATEPDVDSETASFIDAARRAVGRMERTVDDLAGNGRLEIGAAGPVDVAALAREVVAEHAGPAQHRGIHLIITGSTPTTVPTADQAAVQTALGNFLGNAVRLAPPRLGRGGRLGRAVRLGMGCRHRRRPRSCPPIPRSRLRARSGGAATSVTATGTAGPGSGSPSPANSPKPKAAC